MNVASLTTEQILTLAPEKTVLRAAQRTAVATHWSQLGRADGRLWGIYTNRKTQFQVHIRQNPLQLRCSCPAAKTPCPHVLGLLIRFNTQPDTFPTTEPPTWALNAPPTPAPDPRAAEKWRDRLFSGLYDFELWLQDMVRTGLAALPERPRTYWSQMVDRLVDAHLPLLAQDLQALSRLPGKSRDWIDYLLREIGRFYLIVQTGKRYDMLPSAEQVDFRAAVGWFPTTLPAAAAAVADTWLVLGQTNTPLNQGYWQRTWLHGLTSSRNALLSRIVTPPQIKNRWPLPFTQTFITGTELPGTLHFLPSRAPLVALPGEMGRMTQIAQGSLGTHAIHDAVSRAAAALTANPLRAAHPFLLQGMSAVRHETHWLLQDRDGYQLPLPPRFNAGWHLRALSAPTLSLFGMWNGRIFTPLTVWNGRRWLDLRVIRGIQ